MTITTDSLVELVLAGIKHRHKQQQPISTTKQQSAPLRCFWDNVAYTPGVDDFRVFKEKGGARFPKWIKISFLEDCTL